MTQPVPQDLLGEIYSQWATEMRAHPDMSLQLLRIMFDDWQRATVEPGGVTYRSTKVGGVPGILAEPAGVSTDRISLLMHGGGFALGSSASHRKLGGHLAAALGEPVFVADFRLAPEHPYPAGVEDGLSILSAWRSEGRDTSELTVIGDSAGGNLAIAVVLRLLADEQPTPARVVTMSPWLNMENTGATLDTNDSTDFLISREGLQANIDRYLAGGGSATDPYANPLYADLTGFPRLYICAGSVESLYDDSVRLYELAEKCDVDVTFSVGEGQQHVFPFLAGRDARADHEIRSIAAWCRAGA